MKPETRIAQLERGVKDYSEERALLRDCRHALNGMPDGPERWELEVRYRRALGAHTARRRERVFAHA